MAGIKKGSGNHEKTIREFKLEDRTGIRIGSPLKAFQGVLSGVPVFQGDRAQMLRRSDGR
jgi:circadian clock protein KaiC